MNQPVPPPAAPQARTEPSALPLLKRYLRDCTENLDFREMKRPADLKDCAHQPDDDEVRPLIALVRSMRSELNPKGQATGSVSSHPPDNCP
jgi:hypothetical protein